ncbi:hypothetical protein QFC21_006923 [Naganishia friedmannii]|uniref:Uncharacterized protein n=1 Tax=Naganishia friedmannii TaxID=89922 RepID=A0ACC2V085_9TREE|nr:hypothetical protein QFC21_006923 [Naganishia friedmannii]
MSTEATQTQSIISLLEKDKIIPDVLPFAPALQGQLDIVYPTHVISVGETVERVITKDLPVVRFTPFPNSSFQAGPETKYTIAHRYAFLLARESATSAPQASDFPSAQLTHAPSFPKTSENLADRAGFNAHEYLEKKQMPVVGVSYIFVGPDVESLIDNVGVMGRTVVDKVMGR